MHPQNKKDTHPKNECQGTIVPRKFYKGAFLPLLILCHS